METGQPDFLDSRHFEASRAMIPAEMELGWTPFANIFFAISSATLCRYCS